MFSYCRAFCLSFQSRQLIRQNCLQVDIPSKYKLTWTKTFELIKELFAKTDHARAVSQSHLLSSLTFNTVSASMWLYFSHKPLLQGEYAGVVLTVMYEIFTKISELVWINSPPLPLITLSGAPIREIQHCRNFLMTAVLLLIIPCIAKACEFIDNMQKPQPWPQFLQIHLNCLVEISCPW